ncbi:MAG: FimV/HubP family polar landmark protein, partial [Pseudomonadota bacterium]
QLEGSEGGEGAEQSLDSLQNQVNLLRENAESKGEENQELLTRIESLESMLEKQEEIIKLQNEQLAQLQNIAAGEADAPALAAEETAAEPETVPEDTQQEVAANEEQPAAEGSLEAEANVTSSEIPKAKVEPLPDFSGPIPDELLSGEESPGTQEPIVIDEPEPVQKPASFVDNIMAIVKEHARNLMIGAGALLVLILAWVFAKRRASNEEAISASGLPDMDEDDLDDTVVATPDSVDETLDQLEPVDADGMREPSLDSMNNDAERVEDDAAAGDDVIAEADVYISYNLYDQAEELLKEAIAKDPSNVDYQVKLAEVYEGDGNQDGFVNFVKSIAPGMDKSSSGWTKIAAIGAALVPGHELFSDQESDAELTSAESNDVEEIQASDDDDNSLDFSIDEDSESESADDEDEFEEDSGTAIMEAAGMDFGVDQQASGEADDANDTMSFSMDEMDETVSESKEDAPVDQADIDETEAFMLDDEAIGALNEAKSSKEQASEDASDADDVFIDLDQDSLEKELSADPDSEFSMDKSDHSASEEDELDDILNSNSETSIMKMPAFDDNDSTLNIDESEDTVSLEQVQKNLTSELETLSFEDADIDLDAGDDESSLPTLQTKELGRGDVDMENIHDLDEDLTASETGTFEADMLAGEVTEQFDANNLDDALDDLGEFANSSDDLEAPSVAEEIGTKLDLAKAFVDMGDEDAAKETLTEVIDMGDETQIAEAKKLLDKLP